MSIVKALTGHSTQFVFPRIWSTAICRLVAELDPLRHLLWPHQVEHFVERSIGLKIRVFEYHCDALASSLGPSNRLVTSCAQSTVAAREQFPDASSQDGATHPFRPAHTRSRPASDFGCWPQAAPSSHAPTAPAGPSRSVRRSQASTAARLQNRFHRRYEFPVHPRGRSHYCSLRFVSLVVYWFRIDIFVADRVHGPTSTTFRTTKRNDQSPCPYGSSRGATSSAFCP